jgi:hypothetical protein
MDTVIFNRNMGEGLILNNDDVLDIEFDSPTVANEILVPGTSTSMSGYFKHSLEFCGVMDKNKLVFFIGEVNDLLSKKRYYQVVTLISEFRLFSMFTYSSGRDFNFIKGKWK